MTEQEVAEALRAWLADLLTTHPSLAAGERVAATYNFLPAKKGKLPDAAVETAQKRISRGAEESLFFPLHQLQQAMLRVHECQLSFMVDVQGDTNGQAEQELLRKWGSIVEESARSDASLGDRLIDAFISPVMLFDYRLPFVQWGDGTRGRQATVVIAVGELIMDKETS